MAGHYRIGHEKISIINNPQINNSRAKSPTRAIKFTHQTSPVILMKTRYNAIHRSSCLRANDLATLKAMEKLKIFFDLYETFIFEKVHRDHIRHLKVHFTRGCQK